MTAQTSGDSDISFLNTLLVLLDKPETFLHTSNEEDFKDNASLQNLKEISKSLFSRLEQLACLQENINKQNGKNKIESNITGATVDCEDGENYPLSGLSELYVGSLLNCREEESKETPLVDEAIWGQVDIQNNALLSRLKKKIKKLKKENASKKNAIRLLNIETMSLDEEDEQHVLSNDDSDESAERQNCTEEYSKEDARLRKMRERMERSMHDMNNSWSEISQEEESEPVIDPARDELNDGFFDLHEMEAFADEEEEMLPDEAIATQKLDTELILQKDKTKLPHLRDRNRDEDESEGDEFDSSVKQAEASERERRYRDSDDIHALKSLYEGVQDEDEAVNMTAASFFGNPNKPSRVFLDKLKNPNNKKVSFKEDMDLLSIKDGSESEDIRRKPDNDEKINVVLKNEAESSNNNNKNSQECYLENGKCSNHAFHANMLNSLTEQLEREALAEKPWQMVGETKGTKRPVNSLLEATPDFESATKMAPMITVDHTISIEEMIKQRILAEDWDDVIPRKLPDIGLNRSNGDLPEVSQEKSKLSLGELYEREYLKKAVGCDLDVVEKETEEEKSKNEMKMLFANICSKLDALSNYHFTPRPVAKEAVCKTSTTPAIAMEDVLPLYVSDARATAPEEIYANKKGRESVLRGKSEMSKLDRTRHRQAKKAARRKSRKAKLADEKLLSKLQPGLGLNNPYEKRKMQEELQMARNSGKITTGNIDTNSEYNTSAKFFSKMQGNVEQAIHGVINENGKKRKGNFDADNNSHKSSAYKL